MRIDVWADLVCPWCSIGLHRLEAALAGRPFADEVEVVHRSFQLDPGAERGVTRPVVAELARKYRVSEAEAAAMCRRVEQTAAADGLQPFSIAGTLAGSTQWAHELLAFAADEGRAHAAWERLFAAHFGEGRSIFTREALVELAGDVGLDPGEAAQALADGRYVQRVTRDAEQAAALGVTGVPFFLIDGRWTLTGAQPVEVLSEALEQARMATRT
jgi:predicted DsbA family dithiol-disulfide isomerase